MLQCKSYYGSEQARQRISSRYLGMCIKCTGLGTLGIDHDWTSNLVDTAKHTRPDTSSSLPRITCNQVRSNIDDIQPYMINTDL
jgi:hypothetical protein